MSEKANRTSLFRAALLLVVCLFGIIAAFRWNSSPTSPNTEELIQQANKLSNEGEYEAAEQIYVQAFSVTPDDPSLLIRAARCAVKTEKFESAISHLEKVPQSEPEEWLTAQHLMAELYHYDILHLSEAEKFYLKILEVTPDDIQANSGYARLLGLCGRRAEAIPHVLKLIQEGEPTDLLMLLSRESSSIVDSQLIRAAHVKFPKDPNPLLGLAQAAISQQKPEEALSWLRKVETLPGAPDVVFGLIGQQLLAMQNYAELEKWQKDFSKSKPTFDSWLVIAELAEKAGNIEAACRASWEALRLRPESLNGLNQFARRLKQLDRPEAAKPFQDRIQELNQLREQQQKSILSRSEPSTESLLEMIDTLYRVGRNWEALGWCQMMYEFAPDHPELLSFLGDISPEIKKWPLLQTVPERNLTLRMDFSHLKIPDQFKFHHQSQELSLESKLKFVRQTEDVGFNFSYFNGSVETVYQMYGFAGGGLAVLDYDRDGTPDLFCTQGRNWSNESDNDQSVKYVDTLFQNRDHKRFRNVTSSISGLFHSLDGLVETGFGQGVSAGDVNNDGFPDLYVANTGQNALWINNGDGTFSVGEVADSQTASAWTTSCLIADLNQDGSPDLYDVNYLTGVDLFDRLCPEEDRTDVMCSPYDFAAADDAIWIGRGDGHFSSEFTTLLQHPQGGKGLGLVTFRSRENGLGLFVANDTTPNFYFTYSESQPTQLAERALELGLAFNGEGKAEACMGIAVADVDRNGTFDLFVTNFLYESNTLYTHLGAGLFQDATREFGLHAPSLPVLGFGTQFFDADNDGNLELVVNNGFTQDLSASGNPYAMPPQLFSQQGLHFEKIESNHHHQWPAQPTVGRASVKFDWNGDQRTDLAMGTIESPTYLLTNQSDTSEFHAITASFVSLNGARDAIGTIVEATIGDKVYAHQLTAGDGYQCSNERVIHIGCGSENLIQQLKIEWPSGKSETYSNLLTDRQIKFVENRGSYVLP